MIEYFRHDRRWCGEHFRAPGCFHGSLGSRRDVAEKYISGQDMHHTKSDMCRPRYKYGVRGNCSYVYPFFVDSLVLTTYTLKKI